jgi:hypothetical protein
MAHAEYSGATAPKCGRRPGRRRRFSKHLNAQLQADTTTAAAAASPKSRLAFPLDDANQLERCQA